MAEVGEAREGFLCPICKEDLKGVRQLEAHFRCASVGSRVACVCVCA